MSNKIIYNVKNLDCGGCAAKIQNKALTFQGVLSANLDIYKKQFTLEVEKDFEEESFLEKIKFFANSIEPGTEIVKQVNLSEEDELKVLQEKIRNEQRKIKIEKLTILIGGVAFLITICLGKISFKLQIIFSIISYLILGWDVIYKSIKNIFNGNFMDENFLMSIATLGAFYLGEVTESVGVMLFYKIGEFFQKKAVTNSRKSIEKLFDIRPDYANIRDKNGDIVKISPKKLSVDDIIIVKNGEKIPVDGTIIKGEGILNTSDLTGESLPLNVNIGDEVLSGSLNCGDVLEIRVTKLFSESTVSKIVELMENTLTKKAKSEKFITKFAKYYTPIVVILAISVGIITPIFIGNFNLWFSRSLTFLVISCPCALVLSVPLTFFTSIGFSSKKGILIKGGNYLEALTSVDTVVFDKTGTLTKGNFKIDKIECVKSSEQKILETVTIGEFYSNHPIAIAIKGYGNRKFEIRESLISQYKELGGLGTGVFYGDSEILIGNYQLMEKYQIKCDKKSYPGTIIYVAKDKLFLGYIYISDEIKEDSKVTIENLKKLNIKTYMLTGDNKNIADVVAEKIGIDKKNVFSKLLPQDKVKRLEEIKSVSHKKVIFVGDGVNDAPVLSGADIGIAMGGKGSDLAIESADVVIMKDELFKIIELLKIANINKKVVIQNIVLALGIKVIVMILGVLGLANLWLAIFSDLGVSVLAVLNSFYGVKREAKKESL